MFTKDRVRATPIFGMLLLMILAGCSKRMRVSNRKLPEKMTYAELKESVDWFLQEHDTYNVMPYLQRFVAEHADNPAVQPYQLKLGELYLKNGMRGDRESLDMAYRCFKKFARLNPSDTQAEYAGYQAILASFHQTMRIDCDTTMYEKTMKRCKRYLAHDRFARSDYAKDVRNISYTCERRLIDKELYVANVYKNEDKLTSSRSRLQYVLDTYGVRHADIRPRVLYLQAKLDVAEKKYKDAAEKVSLLASQYESSEYCEMGKRLVARAHEPAFSF